jgi:2'-5' RNA ligase
VAILLTEAIRERLATEVERLRPLARDVAWTARDNVHLTLKFLGEVDHARLGTLGEALARATASCSSFSLVIERLGAFPSLSRPRVLWAGVGEGAGAAGALAGLVEAALAPLGFPGQTRAFSAHVTLGRVRTPRADRSLAEALDRGGVFGRQPVDRVSLMRSELSPRGARYTELAAFPLGPEGTR